MTYETWAGRDGTGRSWAGRGGEGWDLGKATLDQGSRGTSHASETLMHLASVALRCLALL
ncbi:hypothetical protein E2C01_031384 [Portunus trituberculatus]|uniref:Uncharacterized protein n=1 Tax=Portunus trituberculatus TaxID=210409 RepID=A0A5B7ESQ6_PORTR|nr:hypothetical protein [Portunus trituberculatus]